MSNIPQIGHLPTPEGAMGGAAEGRWTYPVLSQLRWPRRATRLRPRILGERGHAPSRSWVPLGDRGSIGKIHGKNPSLKPRKGGGAWVSQRFLNNWIGKIGVGSVLGLLVYHIKYDWNACNWFAEKTFRPDKHANIWSRVGIPHIKHTLDDPKHVYSNMCIHTYCTMVSGGNLCNIEGTTRITLNSSEWVTGSGVPTARALSVVTSSERVTRPWYMHPSQEMSRESFSPPRCRATITWWSGSWSTDVRIIGVTWGSVTLWWTNSLLWKDPPFLMGKSTISMAIFTSFLYVHQRVHVKHLEVRPGWSRCNPVSLCQILLESGSCGALRTEVLLNRADGLSVARLSERFSRAGGSASALRWFDHGVLSGICRTASWTGRGVAASGICPWEHEFWQLPFVWPDFGLWPICLYGRVSGCWFKFQICFIILLSISQQTAGWSNFQFVWAGSTYQVWSQLPAIYFGQDWTLCLWPTTCCDARDSASSSGEHCPRPSCERTGWLCRAIEEDHCSLIYWTSSTETSAEESMNIMVLACGTSGVHQCNNWWIHFKWGFRDRNWEFHESDLGILMKPNRTSTYFNNIWVCLKIGYIPNYSNLIGIIIYFKP